MSSGRSIECGSDCLQTRSSLQSPLVCVRVCIIAGARGPAVIAGSGPVALPDAHPPPTEWDHEGSDVEPSVFRASPSCCTTIFLFKLVLRFTDLHSVWWALRPVGDKFVTKRSPMGQLALNLTKNLSISKRVSPEEGCQVVTSQFLSGFGVYRYLCVCGLLPRLGRGVSAASANAEPGPPSSFAIVVLRFRPVVCSSVCVCVCVCVCACVCVCVCVEGNHFVGPNTTLSLAEGLFFFWWA